MLDHRGELIAPRHAPARARHESIDDLHVATRVAHPRIYPDLRASGRSKGLVLSGKNIVPCL
jgi:hypothetical protein